MSRTPIRDAPTPLSSAPLNPSIPRSRHSGPPIRHSRDRRLAPYSDTGRESRGEVWVVAMTLELSHQPMHPIFIPWCAGTLVSRTPGMALQSTSMPALHRRNVPNCRPMMMAERENVARGLVPRWGRGGAWQNPANVPNHNSGFSLVWTEPMKACPDSDPGWIPAPAGDKRRHRSSEYSHRSTMC